KNKNFSIQDAVQKMTSRPAAVLHIDRGLIKEGAAADLNIFNLQDVKALSTYEEPEQLSKGFKYVMCGGKIVVEDDHFLGRNGGQLLRK
ncbi:MAG: amidohydrolase family protein, partial [Lachnospiraceae bacterium]|nr:amidohydrolase family protein [Candidatus Equihabitans merdae]